MELKAELESLLLAQIEARVGFNADGYREGTERLRRRADPTHQFPLSSRFAQCSHVDA